MYSMDAAYSMTVITIWGKLLTNVPSFDRGNALPFLSGDAECVPSRHLLMFMSTLGIGIGCLMASSVRKTYAYR